MAKALLGHLGPHDQRTTAELRRLQQRVRDLEAELMRLQAENDTLAATAQHEELLALRISEPVLA